MTSPRHAAIRVAALAIGIVIMRLDRRCRVWTNVTTNPTRNGLPCREKEKRTESLKNVPESLGALLPESPQNPSPIGRSERIRTSGP